MHIKNKEYLRSILFGVEDSLISTTGFLAGISIASNNPNIILVSGLVAITIEGVSMGVGEYLSDDAMEELDKIKRHPESPLLSGTLLTVSYVLASMIPFLPAVLLPLPYSLILSVTFALVALFVIGYIKGKVIKTSALKGGLKILMVGGITAILGMILGLIFKV